MSQLRRRLTSLILLAALLCGSIPPNISFADAEEDARFEALIGDALRAYTEGEYEKAIDIYFKAKVMRNLPDIDYSIARCYHKLNKCNAAKSSYERVLNRAAGEVSDDLITKSKTQIESLKTCVEQKTDTVQVDPPKVDPPKQDPPKVDPPKQDPPKVDGGGGGVDWLAIGLIGGGGALFLAGLGTDLGSQSLIDDYNYYNTDPTSGTNAERRAQVESLDSDITTRKIVVWSLYGLGAATLATGIVFLVMPDKPAESSTTGLYLQPALSPESAGLLLGGKF